jgi:putative transposase
MEERGISAHHATVTPWVVKYSPRLEEAFHRHKRPLWMNWRLDEGRDNH